MKPSSTGSANSRDRKPIRSSPSAMKMTPTISESTAVSSTYSSPPAAASGATTVAVSAQMVELGPTNSRVDVPSQA